MKKNYSREGSFMIEAMVAIVLAVVGLLGILNLIINSLRFNTDVVNRFVAANLGAEGIELVKNIIDTNYAKNELSWSQGIDSGVYELAYNCTSLDDQVNHCFLIGDIGLAQDPDVVFRDRASFFNFHDGLYDYQAGEPTVFKRIIIIESLDIDLDGNGFSTNDEIKVNVLTRWSERGRTFTVNLEDHFFNWRQPNPEDQPAPLF
ncbi:MAG: hypothetical protein Q8L36_01625 [bacterium]|nr:hypothetical protein [bacterium]